MTLRPEPRLSMAVLGLCTVMQVQGGQCCNSTLQEGGGVFQDLATSVAPIDTTGKWLMPRRTTLRRTHSMYETSRTLFQVL